MPGWLGRTAMGMAATMRLTAARRHAVTGPGSPGRRRSEFGLRVTSAPPRVPNPVDGAHPTRVTGWATTPRGDPVGGKQQLAVVAQMFDPPEATGEVGAGSAIYAGVYPRVSRTNWPWDDLNGMMIANNTPGVSATDGIYMQGAWANGVQMEIAASVGIAFAYGEITYPILVKPGVVIGARLDDGRFVPVLSVDGEGRLVFTPAPGTGESVEG